jgi:hypothetical protein
MFEDSNNANYRKKKYMPATRSTFSCFHKGFGAYCHRCKQATDMEEHAKSMQGQSPPEGVTKKEFADKIATMLVEAKRLRSTNTSRTDVNLG